MITPVDAVGLMLGCGAIGWCIGAIFYAFRRFVWTATS